MNNIKNINSLGDTVLQKKCFELQKVLSAAKTNTIVSDSESDSDQRQTSSKQDCEWDSECDIDGYDLARELSTLASMLPENCNSAFEVLKFIHNNKLKELFSNTSVILTIFLTALVTVATAERSFSKLKLIKTFLRSTLSQERLCGLATTSIESQIGKEIDYSDVIDAFASKKAR